MAGTMRSMAAMKGLLLAEVGDGMVQLDIGSGFTNGPRIVLDAVTPGGGLKTGVDKSLFQTGNLVRHGTLITENASPERTAEELQRLLGNSCAKLKTGGTLLPPPGGTSFENVQMEQAKPRARVELDVVLESNVFVQGGTVRGHAIVFVRKPTKKEGPVLIFGGKIRIIGFESILGTAFSHSFYQCSSPIVDRSYFDECHKSDEDIESITEALEGTFQFPFSMHIPTSDKNGCPKGVVYGLSGATVRYIAIVSFKLKDTMSEKRSIAHFYRACEVWPLLNPEKILVPAPRPLRATASKSLFMGGDGKLTLTATLNETKKAVVSVTLTLLRNTVVFRPLPQLEALPLGKGRYDRDPDACQTATTTKIIAESMLEAGDRATRGHASAKGWWTGVSPRKSLNFSHYIVIPPSEVSLPRSRFLEVEYILKVSLCTGTLLSTDVQVSLPIRLVSFLSVDPYINSILDPGSRNNGLCEGTNRPYGPDTDARAAYAVQDGPCNPSLGADDLDLRDASMDETPLLDGDDDSEYLDSVLLCDSSRIDVSEDVLQRVVTSSHNDQAYGERAPRFSDLYYACMQEHQAAREPVNQPSVAQEETLPSEYHDGSYESRPDDGISEQKSSLRTTKRLQNSEAKGSGMIAYCDHQNVKMSEQRVSSFALRVEEKLRTAHASSTKTSCSGGLSVSDTQTTADKHVSRIAHKNLQTDDKFKEILNRDQVQFRQSEVCGKAGIVKSKILELEKRLGGTNK